MRALVLGGGGTGWGGRGGGQSAVETQGAAVPPRAYPPPALPCCLCRCSNGVSWTWSKCDFDDFNGWADAVDEVLVEKAKTDPKYDGSKYAYRCAGGHTLLPCSSSRNLGKSSWYSQCVCVCVCLHAGCWLHGWVRGCVGSFGWL